MDPTLTLALKKMIRKAEKRTKSVPRAAAAYGWQLKIV